MVPGGLLLTEKDRDSEYASEPLFQLRFTLLYLMNNSSRYLGNGQRPSSTISSSLSIW